MANATDVLRLPFVRAFALGRIASVTGVQIISMTVGWELYDRTNNAWSIAFVGVFELIPVLALFIPAGWVIDRVARRHIAMAAQFLASAAGFGLAAVAITHGPLWVIYALLVLLGTARAFGAPAVASMLPQLLEREQFVHANAWLSTAFELASITGPAIGGFLIALHHRATEAYLVGGACQLLFVLLLFALPLRPPTRTEGRSPGGLWSGVRFIFKNQVFLAAITLDLFAVLLGGAVALLPIYAKDVLHVGPTGLGWLRAAPSLGAMAMALLTTRLPPWKKPGHVLLVVVALFGVATIGFGWSQNFALSLVCLFFTGVFDNISVVIRLTMEQSLTPDRLRGRVSSVHYVFVGFSNELGAFESGSTAALFGPIASVVGGGIGTLLVVGIVALAWPKLRELAPLHELKPLETLLEE